MNLAEDQLRDFVNSLPIMAWVSQTDGKIIYCNHSWRDYTGCELERLMTDGWTASIHTEDLKILADVWLSSEALVQRTVRLRRFDGEYRWFLFRAVAVRNGNGSLERWYGTSTDVHDLKRAETLSSGLKQTLEMVARGESLDRVLTELCNSLDSQFPSMMTSIKLMEPESSRLRHVAGRKVPRSWIKASDSAIVGPTTGSCCAAAFFKRTIIIPDIDNDPLCVDIRDVALSNGLRAALSKPLLSKTGEVLGTICAYFAIEQHATDNDCRLIDEAGSVALLAIERDRVRSALTKDSEEIITSNRQLLEIFDSIPTQVWCALDAHRTEFQNKRWLDYVGLPVEQTKGLGWRDSVHPDDAEEYFNKWAEIAASGSGGQAEARFRRHDGEYRWFLMQAEPLHDAQGNIIRWYGANTDIEDLKRGDEALKKAQMELARVARLTTVGEFATSISHEVNQPLTAIVANAKAALRWLMKEQPDLLEVRLAAERIVESGRRASDIIRGIRELAKKGSPDIANFDVNEAIREILVLMQGELREYSIALELDFAEKIEPLMGNRVQIQQVILNLIRNGIEAMHGINSRRRILRISSQIDSPNSIAIAVADSGEGIEFENLDRIFEAFFTTKPDGTGIGLSICRTILDAHGGRLWASPNFPYGTVFHFSVPAFVSSM
jgi:PAS domain S-box-containing protein